MAQNSCKWDYIFLQRSQTAETASIKLLLKPEASSAATAIAAGGCALIMKWISDQPGAGGASASQVRNVIVMGAQKLPAIEYPNTQWGYGTMNLYHSLDILRRL